MADAWLCTLVDAGRSGRGGRNGGGYSAASGLAAVTGDHYAGGHWLGSFAAYLATRRGIGK